MNSSAAAIGRDDLQWARSEALRTQRRFVELLEERLHETPEGVVERLAEAFCLPVISLGEMRTMTAAFELVPFVEARRRGCAALRQLDDSLVVALSDPGDSSLVDWLDYSFAEPCAIRLAHPSDIAALLAQHEDGLRALDGIALGPGAGAVSRANGEDISIEAIGETESPIVKLVHSTLHDALKAGASDVHFETSNDGLSVKYRIDGVLGHVNTILGIERADQVVSRIKVMASLDISERRVPQDGRFKAINHGREIDFRVSVMPSVFGEDAVLRILDKQALSDQLRGLTLQHLGFDLGTVQQLRRLSQEPYGMLLVTGPTGSGKTTTLYAAIAEVNSGVDKIITIEDPVEYQLPGVLQIPVNERKGLTFARGLRSILRHDPDRIMVGEIRDPETAEIAVQAALTGHLVYTTVHANSVFDVIGRFLHMGVDTFNFVSSLNVVLAQRLVRLNCPHCAAEDPAPAEDLARARREMEPMGTFRFMRGRGCARCRGTGYRGRKAIGELLILNDELRELIVGRAPTRVLRDAARAAGTKSLRHAALELVRGGETTLEEIERETPMAG